MFVAAQFTFERKDFVFAFESFLPDGFTAMEHDVLSKVPDADVSGGDDLPVVGVDLARQDFEQRGFTGAVFADQGDTFARVHFPVDFVEQDLVAIGQGQILDFDHGFGLFAVLSLETSNHAGRIENRYFRYLSSHGSIVAGMGLGGNRDERGPQSMERIVKVILVCFILGLCYFVVDHLINGEEDHRRSMIRMELNLAKREIQTLSQALAEYRAATIGRDEVLSASPEYIQAPMKNGTLAGKVNHDWAYSPTNGLESSGDLLMFGVVEPASPTGLVPSATDE